MLFLLLFEVQLAKCWALEHTPPWCGMIHVRNVFYNAINVIQDQFIEGCMMLQVFAATCLAVQDQWYCHVQSTSTVELGLQNLLQAFLWTAEQQNDAFFVHLSDSHWEPPRYIYIYIYIHNRYYVMQKCIKCLLFMKCRTCFFVCILIVLLVLQFLITSQGQMSFLFLSMSPRPGQLGIFTLFGVRASQSQSPVIKVSRGHKHIIHIYRIHYIVYIINPPAP